jgi:glycosyltransferase involved in cell wall biosynthesis/peptidoglycan/xylan/chitin deacetylase (PgdA/CDA1 family)
MTSINPLSKLQGFYRRTAASVVFRKPFLINPQRPLISFTFDDFPRSALLTGGAILNRYGFAGTYYVSLGLVGQASPSGQLFSLDDLTTLFEQGHELGCHTYSHCESWETDPSVFEDSVIKNQAALCDLFPGAKFESFSYPISMPRPFSKARIAPYFLSCRGGGQTFNAGRTDLNQLSAYFLEKSRHDIQAIKNIIDQNHQSHGWLILATHDVAASPTPFGCTPDFFEEVVKYAVDSGAQILPVVGAMGDLGTPGSQRVQQNRRQLRPQVSVTTKPEKAEPLVSILIPAFNCQEWIADTLRSAIAQTWERKEIIVVDDGSTDQTAVIARQFEKEGVRVVSQRNQGASAARNTAFSLCHGEYIQWLDADDLLAPDKIARQMAVSEQAGSKRALLSSEFGRFLHRTERAQFVPTELWKDLSPVQWLLHKLGRNLYMQTATWLVSRELTEAAGQWDTRLLSDDDGEYFCRVLRASEGVRFVPGAKVYYRAPGVAFGSSLSYIGVSEPKIRAHWISMQLHIHYLLSMEDSQQVRSACLRYLQACFIYYYPEMPDIVQEVKELAAQLGGQVAPPHLSWKYSWIQAFLGWRLAKQVQSSLVKIRWNARRLWDKAGSDRSNNRQIGRRSGTHY